MAYGFLKPTRYKLILFAVLSVIIYFLPVMPAPSGPVTMGVSDQYFGAAGGGVSGALNILYVLTAGYLISCAVFYLFHALHK